MPPLTPGSYALTHAHMDGQTCRIPQRHRGPRRHTGRPHLRRHRTRGSGTGSGCSTFKTALSGPASTRTGCALRDEADRAWRSAISPRRLDDAVAAGDVRGHSTTAPLDTDDPPAASQRHAPAGSSERYLTIPLPHPIDQVVARHRASSRTKGRIGVHSGAARSAEVTIIARSINIAVRVAAATRPSERSLIPTHRAAAHACSHVADAERVTHQRPVALL